MPVFIQNKQCPFSDTAVRKWYEPHFFIADSASKMPDFVAEFHCRSNFASKTALFDAEKVPDCNFASKMPDFVAELHCRSNFASKTALFVAETVPDCNFASKMPDFVAETVIKQNRRMILHSSSCIVAKNSLNKFIVILT